MMTTQEILARDVKDGDVLVIDKDVVSPDHGTKEVTVDMVLHDPGTVTIGWTDNTGEYARIFSAHRIFTKVLV